MINNLGRRLDGFLWDLSFFCISGTKYALITTRSQWRQNWSADVHTWIRISISSTDLG